MGFSVFYRLSHFGNPCPLLTAWECDELTKRTLGTLFIGNTLYLHLIGQRRCQIPYTTFSVIYRQLLQKKREQSKFTVIPLNVNSYTWSHSTGRTIKKLYKKFCSSLK